MADKPTKKEHAKRVIEIAHMLATGMHEWEIKQELRTRHNYAKYGAERLIRAARALLIKQSGTTKVEAKARALEVYFEIVRDKSYGPQIRIQAQMRIDKILGLEEPHQVRQFVSGKQEITVKYEGDDWQEQERFCVDTGEPTNN